MCPEGVSYSRDDVHRIRSKYSALNAGSWDPERHSFLTTEESQGGSALLSLPAELRVKILRNLLKKNRPLATKSELRKRLSTNQEVERSYWRNTNLSSQILRTCQQLYKEGQDILYKENTLTLRASSQPPSKTYQQHIPQCSILNHTIEYRHFDLEPPEQEDDLFEYVKEQTLSYGKHNIARIKPLPEHTRCVVTILDLYPVFRQFTKFRIVVEHYQEIDLVAACRVFRALVKEREVTLESICESECTSGACVLKPQNCAVLRCTSFEIENFDEADAAEVTSIICSGKPVDDTYAKYRAFERMVEGLPKKDNGGSSFHGQFEEDLEDMMCAAMRYDTANFKEIRIFLLGKAQEWLQGFIAELDEYADESVNT